MGMGAHVHERSQVSVVERPCDVTHDRMQVDNRSVAYVHTALLQQLLVVLVHLLPRHRRRRIVLLLFLLLRCRFMRPSGRLLLLFLLNRCCVTVEQRFVNR